VIGDAEPDAQCTTHSLVLVYNHNFDPGNAVRGHFNPFYPWRWTLVKA